MFEMWWRKDGARFSNNLMREESDDYPRVAGLKDRKDGDAINNRGEEEKQRGCVKNKGELSFAIFNVSRRPWGYDVRQIIRQRVVGRREQHSCGERDLQVTSIEMTVEIIMGEGAGDKEKGTRA